jgi:ethanolamine utilization cobalamin adenosyltransferase
MREAITYATKVYKPITCLPIKLRLGHLLSSQYLHGNKKYIFQKALIKVVTLRTVASRNDNFKGNWYVSRKKIVEAIIHMQSSLYIL